MGLRCGHVRLRPVLIQHDSIGSSMDSVLRRRERCRHRRKVRDDRLRDGRVGAARQKRPRMACSSPPQRPQDTRAVLGKESASQRLPNQAHYSQRRGHETALERTAFRESGANTRSLGVTTENELRPSEAEQKWHAPARGPGTQQEQTEAPGNTETVKLAPGWLRAKTEPAKGRQDDQRQHIPRTEREPESRGGRGSGDTGWAPPPAPARRQTNRPHPAQEPELEASPGACPVGGQWKQQRGILCNSRNPLLGQTDPS